MTHREDSSRAEHAREVRAEAAEAKAEAKAEAAEAKAEAEHRAKAAAAKAIRTTASPIFGALASLITQCVRVEVKGAKLGDVVAVTPQTNLGDDSLSFSGIVVAADMVALRVHNTGNSMRKPDDTVWNIVVFPHD
jgi:hypothetical protein